MDKTVERTLRTIPGVGPAMARDLWQLGIRSLGELADQDPEDLYERMKALSGGKLDRCVLYVFREAVYFAKTPPGKRDPDKLKWWHWKD